MVSLLATTAATCQELTWIDNGSNPARRPIRPSTSPNKYSYTLMQLIRQTKAERELALCCDIHGHNRKKNIFICISEMIQMAVHQETTQRKSKYSPCWWVKIAEYSISKIVASKSKKIAKEPPEYHIIFIIDRLMEGPEHYQLLHPLNIFLWVRFRSIWVLPFQSQYLQRYRTWLLSITGRLLWTHSEQSEKSHGWTGKFCQKFEDRLKWQKQLG